MLRDSGSYWNSQSLEVRAFHEVKIKSVSFDILAVLDYIL
jgi:hypothetical protein